MTPHAFIAKWRHATLSERAAAQSHFVALCRLIGQPDPITADPTGEWFTFEKGVAKTSGGEGRGDVCKRGCFGWEHKGRERDLDAVYSQLLNHAIANPPLLIVDGVVADAYGWGEDFRAGRLDDKAILGRLFALNQARAAREAGS